MSEVGEGFCLSMVAQPILDVGAQTRLTSLTTGPVLDKTRQRVPWFRKQSLDALVCRRFALPPEFLVIPKRFHPSRILDFVFEELYELEELQEFVQALFQ